MTFRERCSYLTGLLLVRISFLQAIDTKAQQSWAHVFGNSGNDTAYSIKQTSDGGYIAAGFAESFGSLGSIWVLKLDTYGAIQWQKTYGGSNIDFA